MTEKKYGKISAILAGVSIIGLVIFPIGVLCSVPGAIFGYLGLKQDSNKTYSILGLSVNLIVLLILLILVVMFTEEIKIILYNLF